MYANLLLQDIQRVREGNEPHKHIDGFARHMLRIPDTHYYALLRMYPALSAFDPEERTKAWEHFERTPFAQRYAVGRITRGFIHDGVITK